MQKHQTVVGVYLIYIDDLLKELGVCSEQIFIDSGFSYPNYVQPGERVSIDLLGNLVRNITDGVDEPGFFLELGKRIPVIANGYLGPAILACKDVRSALLLTQRYSALAFPMVKLFINEFEEESTVEVQPRTVSSDLNKAFVDAMIGTINANMTRITGVVFYPKRMSVIYSKQDCPYLLKAYSRCSVSFSANSNELVFSQHHLDLPITTADKLGEQLSVEQCEEELVKMQAGLTLLDRIREIITLYLDSSPSIQFVSDKLRISERTLRRRLADEGMSYRELLKDMRHEAATYYLTNTDMRVEQIAWKLGYKESSNFRKAFKARAGLAPREWRESQENEKSY